MTLTRHSPHPVRNAATQGLSAGQIAFGWKLPVYHPRPPRNRG
jgi:hypothetical protein